MKHSMAKIEGNTLIDDPVKARYRWLCTCGASGPWFRDQDVARKGYIQHSSKYPQQHQHSTEKTMAQATTTKPTTKPAPAPTTKPQNGAPMSAAAAKAEGKRPRVRWQSVKDPAFWVRSFKDVTDKYGAPKDPWGETMVPAARGGFQADPARKAAKAEREAKLSAMTAEEKLAFLKTERETRKAAKAERDAHKLNQLRAQIEAEVKAKHGIK